MPRPGSARSYASVLTLGVRLETRHDSLAGLAPLDTTCLDTTFDHTCGIAVQREERRLGTMERAFAMTLDYLRARQQFGRTIGSFQALQHRAVDLRIAIALTRASVEAAAMTLDGGQALAECQAAVSRAKARAAEAALLLTRAAVQLHGAIGYTDEYNVGLCMRKAMVLANAFGSAAAHRRRFMAARMAVAE